MTRLFALVANRGGTAGVLCVSAVARVYAAVAAVPKAVGRVVLAMPVAAAVALAVPQPFLELDFTGGWHALGEEVAAAVAVLQTLRVAEALLQAVGAVLFLIAPI